MGIIIDYPNKGKKDEKEPNFYTPPKEPPVPFNAIELKKLHDWVTEPEDILVPGDGFINDLVLKYRGTEAPTLFCIWNGLALTSMVLKRDAYLSWGDKRFIPNLYLFFVGMPGLARKTTSVGIVSELYSEFSRFNLEPRLKAKKKVILVQGLTTDEKLFFDLQEKPSSITLPDGKRVKIHAGSAGALILGELTSAITKTKPYLEGLINTLLELYDCKEEGTEKRTLKNGVLELKDVYFSMLGATTPELMATQLPKEVLGGGFARRSLFIYKPKSQRLWGIPQTLPGCPTTKDLMERMAWLAQWKHGAFYLENEALDYYSEWYAKFRTRLNSTSDRYRQIHGGADGVLLRVALLLRAQSYTPGRNIRVRDLRLAEALLDMTYRGTMALFDKLTENPVYEIQEKILAMLKDSAVKGNKGVPRSTIQSRIARIAPVNLVDEALRALNLQGLLTIRDVQGGRVLHPRSNGSDRYFMNEKGYKEELDAKKEGYQSISKTPYDKETFLQIKKSLENFYDVETEEDSFLDTEDEAWLQAYEEEPLTAPVQETFTPPPEPVANTAPLLDEEFTPIKRKKQKSLTEAQEEEKRENNKASSIEEASDKE